MFVSSAGPDRLDRSSSANTHASRPKTASTSRTTRSHSAKPSWVSGALVWAYELMLCFVSVAILMTLIAVLSMHDRKPLPELPLGVTLSTIIAILSTASRSVALMIISRGISQLKWNWFAGGSRSLSDLVTFDQASRGPIGGLKLLLSTRGK